MENSIKTGFACRVVRPFRWERPTRRDADQFPASSGVAILHLPPARKLPASLRRSLTRDRGLEMAKHKAFTVATNVKVYFCDPQSPWQRGTNENTNRLPRQYFSKRTDLSGYSQAELDKVALRLN
jgi:IS30 family transposase